MKLPSPTSLNDWPDQIAEDVRSEYRGKITVYVPAVYGDVDFDTGIREIITQEVIYVGPNRPARIQQLRQPIDATTSDEWGTKRTVQFQYDLVDTDPIVTKGLRVRVDDGGRDKSLESFSYTVRSAANSSSAAVRTLITVGEFAVVGS